ncbi:MAG TPA: peptidase domain-containing ABC transporter, partial [Terriglobia bacterium]|nr:peptidase domain-containing ABC transporter [Terriglobia bacterium]
ALAQLFLPAVAHWREDNRNHFVVLYSVSPQRIVVGDPAAGLRTLTPEEFQKKWTGVLLLLKPTPRLREAVNSKSAFSRMFLLLLPHYRLFLDALLAAVLMTILGLTSSFFIQALVDFVFVLGRTPALNWLGLGMLLVTLARAGFLGLRSFLLTHLSQRIDAETVPGYHRHLLGLPLTFYYSRHTGEILSRLNDAIRIRVAISATTLSVIVDSLLVLTTAAIMTWLDWKLALQSLQLVPVLAVIVWLLNKPMKRHQRAAMEKAATVEAQLVETIVSIHTIKAYRAESRIRLRTEALFNEMLQSSFRSQQLAVHSTTLSSLMVGLSTVALLWFGGHQVLAGTLTVGQLMACYAMLGTILGPIERLANANQSIQDAIIAAGRLGEVLELDPELKQQRANALDRAFAGSIEFQNIAFRYGSRLPVFENFSLTIQPGECIGIIGESGCGKTTLVNMLARFLEPTSGRILIDGLDTHDYTFECLRREIAVVPQDTVLLNGTIAENIRLGQPAATSAEIRAAARAARVDEFVDRLAHGYDTIVGERGLALSGGERQRIAIARAILLNPSILVLDEPTSHLDSQSELAVQSLIDQRRGIRTTIVISHRPLNVSRLIDLNQLRRDQAGSTQSASISALTDC